MTKIKAPYFLHSFLEPCVEPSTTVIMLLGTMTVCEIIIVVQRLGQGVYMVKIVIMIYTGNYPGARDGPFGV